MESARACLLPLLLLFVVLSGVDRLSAQEASPTRPLEISLGIEGAEGTDPAIASLLRESLAIELGLAGMRIVSGAEADLHIAGRYAVIDDRLRFSFAVLIPGRTEPLAIAEGEETLGLNLDSAILARAEELADVIIRYRDQHSDQFELSPELPVGEGVTQEEAPENRAEEEPSADEQVSVDPSPEALSTIDSPAEESRGTGFSGAVDLGLFLAAGDAGRYLKTGYRASLYAGFYRSPALRMGLGTGIIYFQAEGFSAEATGFIVPLLPELRYILAGSEDIRTGIHGGVGGALFVVSSEAQTSQTKIVPAAEAGMITELDVRGIVLQIILDITLFYENSNLLYGFSPRLGLKFR